MTVAEAAELLGLSPVTVRIQIRNGKLRAVKRGRDWWLTAADVERYRAHSLRRTRCTARHPMHAEQVRCELAAGHDGQHGHSFFARYWDGPERMTAKERRVAEAMAFGAGAEPIIRRS